MKEVKFTDSTTALEMFLKGDYIIQNEAGGPWRARPGGPWRALEGPGGPGSDGFFGTLTGYGKAIYRLFYRLLHGGGWCC